jgi:hypothetical protein
MRIACNVLRSSVAVVLAIIVTILADVNGILVLSIFRQWLIRVGSVASLCVPNPPTNLSTDSLKPRIAHIGELGHIHMVGVYSDEGVPWHDC